MQGPITGDQIMQRQIAGIVRVALDRATTSVANRAALQASGNPASIVQDGQYGGDLTYTRFRTYGSKYGTGAPLAP